MRFNFERVAELSATLLVCAAVCLGGGSHDNAAPLAATELLALPALGIGAFRVAETWDRSLRLPLAILATLFLIPILQLIPLPPALWTHFPGRSGVIAVLHAAGIGLPVLPFSLTPEATAHCALALIPPAGLFLVVCNLDLAARARVSLLLVALALASVLLGLLQVAQGSAGGFRLYPLLGDDAVVGFFSNRDHLSDLLACAIPLAAGASVALGRSSSPLRHFAGRAAILVIPLLIMGIAVTASRAGFILGFIGLSAAILGARRERKGAGRLALGLTVASALLLTVAALNDRLPAIARFMDTGADLRLMIQPSAARAAAVYWPVGSGIGSFIPVFMTVQPMALVGPFYINHAHNEYIEATLESGLAAWLVVIAFVVWWVRRSVVAWRGRRDAGARLAQAGSVVVGMILLHCTVDFPLRTVTLTSVLALACALMTPPPAKTRSGVVSPQ